MVGRFDRVRRNGVKEWTMESIQGLHPIQCSPTSIDARTHVYTRTCAIAAPCASSSAAACCSSAAVALQALAPSRARRSTASTSWSRPVYFSSGTDSCDWIAGGRAGGGEDGRRATGVIVSAVTTSGGGGGGVAMAVVRIVGRAIGQYAPCCRFPLPVPCPFWTGIRQA